MTLEATVINRNLAEAIQSRCGENAMLCYQCKKCSAGCPVSRYMDLAPNQVMRAIQFGREDQVLNCQTIWLCASCETCFTRCPQGIDIPRIMDAAKNLARERGIKPRIPDVAIFYDLALDWIDRIGRVYELGLMGEFNMRTRQPVRNADLGIKMFRAGKIKILPSIAMSRGKVPKRQVPRRTEAKRVAYYPGCSLHSTASEYDASTRAVARKLGLELVEPKGWVCCGTGAAHTKSKELATVLPMRSLAMVDANGDTKLTLPCAACFSRFRTAIHDVQHDPAMKQAVLDKVGYEYDGQIEVQNLIDTFTKVVGLDEIGRQVTKPLAGLKVVCYYGCLLTRPPEVTGAEQPDYPMTMDRLLRRLGATVLDWSYKTECCGASLMLTQTDVALDLTRRIIQNAVDVGADTIAVACPICHANLDSRQYQVAQKFGKVYDMPVFYFTQLMGIAMEIDPKRLELQKHFVDPKPLLRRKGLTAAQ
ncbi:MAG: heterodisulfide reductase-related iron-sulfur binding cluster [Chloroflexota bacterium]